MRLLITGDRNWWNAIVVDRALEDFLEDEGLHPPDVTLVQGMARGADTVAYVVGQLWELQQEPHPANWEAHGRASGPIRNQEMLDAEGGIDYVLAFHDDIQNSRGTRDMLRRCRDAGIPGRLYFDNGDSGDYTELI